MLNSYFREMLLILILCVTVFISSSAASEGTFLEIEENESRLQGLCSRGIPEDRSVEVGGECRTSLNCQQEDAGCVNVRENYCECQVTEDRKIKKWKKKYRNKKNKECKSHEGHSCVPAKSCKKKYKKRGKICKHPKQDCCTECKNLDDHKCMPSKDCPGKLKKSWYQCKKKSNVCCSTLCYGAPPCEETKYCDPVTKKCECAPPRNLANGVCVSEYTAYNDAAKSWSEAKTFCEQKGGELAMMKNKEEVSTFADFLLNTYGTGGPKLWVGIIDLGGKNYEFVDGTSASDILGVQTSSYLTDDSKLWWSDSSESPSPTDTESCMVGYSGSSIPAIDDRDCSMELGVICQNVD